MKKILPILLFLGLLNASWGSEAVLKDNIKQKGLLIQNNSKEIIKQANNKFKEAQELLLLSKNKGFSEFKKDDCTFKTEKFDEYVILSVYKNDVKIKEISASNNLEIFYVKDNYKKSKKFDEYSLYKESVTVRKNSQYSKNLKSCADEEYRFYNGILETYTNKEKYTSKASKTKEEFHYLDNKLNGYYKNYKTHYSKSFSFS